MFNKMFINVNVCLIMCKLNLNITLSREDNKLFVGESTTIGNSGSKSRPQIVQPLAPLTELLEYGVTLPFIFRHAILCTLKFQCLSTLASLWYGNVYEHFHCFYSLLFSLYLGKVLQHVEMVASKTLFKGEVRIIQFFNITYD